MTGAAPSGLVLAVLFALAARGAAQQGGEITGLSAIAAGRAGAGGAGGDNVLESARNPAVLCFLFRGGRRFASDTALEIDARGVWAPARGRDSSGLPFRADSSVAAGGWLGWATRVGESSIFGVTVLPTFAGDIELNRVTKLDVGTPTRLRQISIDTNLLQVGVQPALAFRASEELALGFGASLRHTRIGLSSATEIDVLDTFKGETGLVAGQTWGELFSGAPFNISRIQTEYDGRADGPLTASVQVGAMWAPEPETRFGLWYRSTSTPTDIEGHVNVDLEPELGPILDFFGLDAFSRYELEFRDVSFPQQLGVAFSHDATPRDRVHMDFTWTDWSNTFNGFTAYLTNPSTGDFTNLVGGDGSTDFDLDLRWKDVYTWSFGYEHDLSRAVTLRGGLGWASDPTTGSVSPGTHVFNSWHVAVGASFWGGLGGNWHVAVVAALPETHQAGTNTTLTDFSGDSYRVAFYSAAVAYTLNW